MAGCFGKWYQSCHCRVERFWDECEEQWPPAEGEPAATFLHKGSLWVHSGGKPLNKSSLGQHDILCGLSFYGAKSESEKLHEWARNRKNWQLIQTQRQPSVTPTWGSNLLTEAKVAGEHKEFALWCAFVWATYQKSSPLRYPLCKLSFILHVGFLSSAIK